MPDPAPPRPQLAPERAALVLLNLALWAAIAWAIVEWFFRCLIKPAA